MQPRVRVSPDRVPGAPPLSQLWAHALQSAAAVALSWALSLLVPPLALADGHQAPLTANEGISSKPIA